MVLSTLLSYFSDSTEVLPNPTTDTTSMKRMMDMADMQEDRSAWFLDNSMAEFVLMRGVEVQFMCLVGYAFYQGCQVFKSFEPNVSASYKFISLVLSCTGGGILVPILINEIPFPLANDQLMIAIIISFVMHMTCPILRDVMDQSCIMKSMLITFHEIVRTSVVIKLLLSSTRAIPPSLYSYPLIGPIACGILAGIGGMFLPFSKGLNVLKYMKCHDEVCSQVGTVVLGVVMVHLFWNTWLSEGMVNAKEKAHFALALCFITAGLMRSWPLKCCGSMCPAVRNKNQNKATKVD